MTVKDQRLVSNLLQQNQPLTIQLKEITIIHDKDQHTHVEISLEMTKRLDLTRTCRPNVRRPKKNITLHYRFITYLKNKDSVDMILFYV